MANELAKYYTQCAKKKLMVYQGQEHKGTVNDLCRRGLLQPVEFTAYDGKRRKANCHLTACEYLAKIGHYTRPEYVPVIWH